MWDFFFSFFILVTAVSISGRSSAFGNFNCVIFMLTYLEDIDFGSFGCGCNMCL